MKTNGLSARKLRIILLLVLALIALSAIGGFYFMQGQLRAYAADISRLNAVADSGGKNLVTLRQLSTDLKKLEGTIQKTKDIVAESKEYVYQDQIIEDLTKISQTTGVTVTGFTFSSPSAAGTTGEAAAPATEAPQATTPVAATSSLKSQTVTVAFESPLEYDRFMSFIKAIELNPLKMQIASVTMTKAEGNNVTSDSFTLEVYVR